MTGSENFMKTVFLLGQPIAVFHMITSLIKEERLHNISFQTGEHCLISFVNAHQTQVFPQVKSRAEDAATRRQCDLLRCLLPADVRVRDPRARPVHQRQVLANAHRTAQLSAFMK